MGACSSDSPTGPATSSSSPRKRPAGCSTTTSAPSTSCSGCSAAGGVAGRPWAGSGCRLDGHPRGGHRPGRRRERGHERAYPVHPAGQEDPRARAARGAALHHNYIGTEHILLGLIREGDGVGAQIIAAQARPAASGWRCSTCCRARRQRCGPALAREPGGADRGGGARSEAAHHARRRHQPDEAARLAGAAGRLAPPVARRPRRPQHGRGPGAGRPRRRPGPGPGGAAQRGRHRHQRRAARGAGPAADAIRVTDTGLTIETTDPVLIRPPGPRSRRSATRPRPDHPRRPAGQRSLAESGARQASLEDIRRRAAVAQRAKAGEAEPGQPAPQNVRLQADQEDPPGEAGAAGHGLAGPNQAATSPFTRALARSGREPVRLSGQVLAFGKTGQRGGTPRGTHRGAAGSPACSSRCAR